MGYIVRRLGSCVICFALRVFPTDQHVYSAGFWGYRAKQPSSNFRLAGHLSRNEGFLIRKKMNLSFICEDEEDGDVPKTPKTPTWYMLR